MGVHTHQPTGAELILDLVDDLIAAGKASDACEALADALALHICSTLDDPSDDPATSNVLALHANVVNQRRAAFVAAVGAAAALGELSGSRH